MKITQYSILKNIIKAVKSDGCLIIITSRNKEILTHTFFTKNFKDGDIEKSLSEHLKNLSPIIYKSKNVK